MKFLASILICCLLICSTSLGQDCANGSCSVGRVRNVLSLPRLRNRVRLLPRRNRDFRLLPLFPGLWK